MHFSVNEICRHSWLHHQTALVNSITIWCINPPIMIALESTFTSEPACCNTSAASLHAALIFTSPCIAIH